MLSALFYGRLQTARRRESLEIVFDVPYPRGKIRSNDGRILMYRCCLLGFGDVLLLGG